MSEVVRAAIVAKLEGIPDIGRVHAFERYSKNMEQLKGHYLWEPNDGRPNQLRGWFVRRLRANEASEALGQSEEGTTWIIRGYMALSDESESELVFDRLIDAIRGVFRADETLGGVVATTVMDDEAWMQLDESGPVLFAGVLCHSAKLRLTTRILRILSYG
jgi:hypothetical protein